MKSGFLITSKALAKNQRPDGLDLISSSEAFEIYGHKKAFFAFNDIKILLDGYVVPRIGIFETYKNHGQHDLIHDLFVEYGQDFPSLLKGFFSILIFRPKLLIVCNDRHSVKRFYILSDPSSYMISNRLELLNAFRPFELKREAGAIQATLQHFVAGNSMFHGIEYSAPASLIKAGKELEKRTYWKPGAMANLSRESGDRHTIIEIFTESVRQYVEYLKPRNISLTLTGGRDTRSILAALLYLGCKPHCFTFGFPTGTDVVTAKKVAQAADLDFSNHYIEELVPSAYRELTDRIVEYGNPFIHIHRAHRFDAIIKESKIINHIDAVFVGAMGGDYIMGEGFNDYIITEFIRKYLTENGDERHKIRDILDKHFVKYDDGLLDYIILYLQSLA